MSLNYTDILTEVRSLLVGHLWYNSEEISIIEVPNSDSGDTYVFFDALTDNPYKGDKSKKVFDLFIPIVAHTQFMGRDLGREKVYSIANQIHTRIMNTGLQVAGYNVIQVIYEKGKVADKTDTDPYEHTFRSLFRIIIEKL